MNRDQWINKNSVPHIGLLIKKTQQYIDNKDWYANSNALINKCFDDPNLFIDILAITSPRTTVKRNCINSIKTYEQITNNKALTVNYGITHTNTKRNIDLMLTDNIFNGVKINTFSNALKLKEDNNIVIDVWTLKAFNLKRRSPTHNDTIHITAIIKEIALKLCLQPYEVQACLWVYAKTELNTTVYKDSHDFSYYIKAHNEQTKLNIGV